jgi:hypothetical protein
VTYPWMYLNAEGQVVTGAGCVLTIEAAKALPWVQAYTSNAGAAATPEMIAAEWRRVHACQAASHLGGSCFRRMTTLRLTDADLAALE